MRSVYVLCSHLKSTSGLVSGRTHKMGSLYFLGFFSCSSGRFAAISGLSDIENSSEWRHLCHSDIYGHEYSKEVSKSILCAHFLPLPRVLHHLPLRL